MLQEKMENLVDDQKKMDRLRNAMANAKNRCCNSRHHAYARYGGRGVQFTLTQKEIKELWNRDCAYNLSEPSIDRINNDGHYDFDNCRFIERYDNAIKRHPPIKINQRRLNGRLICRWESISAASKVLNLSYWSILLCAKGIRKSCAKYLFEYAKE